MNFECKELKAPCVLALLFSEFDETTKSHILKIMFMKLDKESKLSQYTTTVHDESTLDNSWKGAGDKLKKSHVNVDIPILKNDYPRYYYILGLRKLLGPTPRHSILEYVQSYRSMFPEALGSVIETVVKEFNWKELPIPHQERVEIIASTTTFAEVLKRMESYPLSDELKGRYTRIDYTMFYYGMEILRRRKCCEIQHNNSVRNVFKSMLKGLSAFDLKLLKEVIDEELNSIEEFTIE